MKMHRKINLADLLPVIAALLLNGCSLNRFAVNVIGDAMSDGGGVYSTDNDPQLIREALPFGLKVFESLLEVSPDHQGLLLSASRGFAAYAFIVQSENEQRDKTDVNQSREQGDRIRNLFLRGRDFALRGLDVRHRGLADQLRKDPSAALAVTTKDDAPFLYWGGASWGGAISAAKGDLNLLADLPLAGALVQRVLELDERHDLGAAHEFFISFEASRPGGTTARVRQHYRRALDLSGGQRASVHLALAEAVAVKEQNLGEFRDLISAAMAVPIDKRPELRLVNTIARQRALWLEKRIEDLFVDAPPLKENAQ